jgi:hypothetical protein
MTKNLHEFAVEHSTSFDDELAESLKDPAYCKLYPEAKHELEVRLIGVHASQSHDKV